CTGNTCRSPLAEAIVKRMVSDAGRTDIEVASAGVQAWNGSPASDEALLVGLERNLDLSDHRSRLLTPEIAGASDLILTMSESHVAHVKKLNPHARVHLLAGFASADGKDRTIQDPFGGDLAAYRETADELERELAGLLDRIGR
ncbi:MAG: low molecular weight protein arginine phosphatase, partial [Gemmatimonadaceae bacterium]